MKAQGMTEAQIIPELPRPRFGRCFFLLATLQPEAPHVLPKTKTAAACAEAVISRVIAEGTDGLGRRFLVAAAAPLR
jgi:hypothetical protein